MNNVAAQQRYISKLRIPRPAVAPKYPYGWFDFHCAVCSAPLVHDTRPMPAPPTAAGNFALGIELCVQCTAFIDNTCVQAAFEQRVWESNAQLN